MFNFNLQARCLRSQILDVQYVRFAWKHLTRRCPGFVAYTALGATGKNRCLKTWTCGSVSAMSARSRSKRPKFGGIRTHIARTAGKSGGTSTTRSQTITVYGEETCIGKGTGGLLSKKRRTRRPVLICLGILLRVLPSARYRRSSRLYIGPPVCVPLRHG